MMNNIYFLTLIPFGYGVPGADDGSRCVGIFSEEKEFTTLLNEDTTEGGYYKLAVVEKLVEPGLHPRLEVVEWLQWNAVEGWWVTIDPPKMHERIANWAIG